MFDAKYSSSSSFGFFKEDFFKFLYYIHLRQSNDPELLFEQT
jgi:hypothetical protein